MRFCYIRKRRFFPRRRLSRRQEVLLARRVIALVLLLALVVFITVSLYNKAAPIAAENAVTVGKNRMENLIQSTVQEIITEENYQYDSFASPITDSEGKILAIAVNSIRLAAARTLVLSRLSDKMEAGSAFRIRVPVGTLIAPKYLGGRGFGIGISATAYTAFRAEVISDIRSAGINQTLHTLSIRVTADSTLYCMSEKNEISLACEITLAESLTFGNIPDSYFEYGNGGESP